jgi:hypothetical protein
MLGGRRLVDWIYLEEARDKRRTPIHTLMNFYVA